MGTFYFSFQLEKLGEKLLKIQLGCELYLFFFFSLNIANVIMFSIGSLCCGTLKLSIVIVNLICTYMLPRETKMN